MSTASRVALARLPSTDYSELCEKCITIDLKSTLSKVWRPSEADHQLLRSGGGPQVDNWTISCVLCQLLRAIADDEMSVFWPYRQVLLHKPKHEVIGLLATQDNFIGVAKSISRSGWYSSYDPYPNRYLCVSTDPSKGPAVRLLDPQSIDFEILQQWLSTCSGQHDQTCGLAEGAHVPGLQLLNVYTESLQAVHGQVAYVALSYVWGGNNARDSDDGFPLTISDAITVTKKLGFDYLWVDRYCIPQEQERVHDMQEQISHMADIYRNAQLTIIAASGETPEHGLPGVSSTPRAPQPCGKIGEHTLVSTLKDPRALVDVSRWNSRGWTYQEGLCSRRRLIFTDEQVLFECEKMSCRESVDFAWSLDAYNIFKRAHEISPIREGKSGLELVAHIHTYTKKKLKYDHDALNGLLGVLRLYQRGANPAYHYWGLPIAGNLLGRGSRQDTFLASLQWNLTNPGRRRAGFPTWSWTAWDATAEWDIARYRVFESAAKTKVLMRYKDGSFEPFDQLYDRFIRTNQRGNLSNTLRIDGWTIELDAKVFPSTTNFSGSPTEEPFELFAWPAEPPSLQEDLQSVAPVILTEPINDTAKELWKTVPRQLLGIVLNQWPVVDWDDSRSLFILVVAKVPDRDVYERVGHLTLIYRYMAPKLISTGLRPPDCEMSGPHDENYQKTLAVWKRNIVFRRVTLPNLNLGQSGIENWV